ncbi:MAG: malonyl-CoA decarboxylase family protein [Alphaproteobacteria bacterium]|nr:malonyl-CoA decarboxylase family protein [Alphaproteobacteria bacterium]
MPDADRPQAAESAAPRRADRAEPVKPAPVEPGLLEAEAAPQARTPAPGPEEPGLLLRTWESVRTAWRELSGAEAPARARADLGAREQTDLKRRIAACLTARGGEVSARQRAAGLGQIYLDLGREGRKRFLTLLAEEFGPDRAAVNAAVERYRDASDEAARRDAQDALRGALAAPRVRLLTQFNALPQGVKFLVDMRADALSFLKEAPELAPVERDLKALLTSWFDIGFLEMQAINWQSPAALLEKLIEYEAVHEIRSWDDLHNRLAADRRLYAFFHPNMPMEPLIFVEVALVKGLAGNVQTLLDEDAPTADPRRQDTAIFYSISNTQTGLRGISLGNFLIKRVVDDLQRDLPNLKTFSTLSPIPGFRKWMEGLLAEGAPKLLTAEDRKRLKQATGRTVAKGHLPELLADPGWVDDPALAAALKEPLMRLCARYLVREKKRGGPRDPVARFHLSNGAQVERINWLGDRSQKGLAQSCGMMVNYLYKLSDIERNHERFAEEGHIAVSGPVKALL